MSVDLFTPLTLGPLTLSNRVFMAPLTRMRATMPGNVPGELNAIYYRQRATAGLIVTEATPVSPHGHGYFKTPGIHTEAQAKGWKLVTRAVHEAGGRIFCQLWHVGRQSHPDLQPGGVLPVAPSALAGDGESPVPSGVMKGHVVPRALGTDEVPGIVEEFRHGAELAKAAGFDGVEVHGANGYLLEQFLLAGSNRRTDRYGGSVEDRARFYLEVVRAVTEVGAATTWALGSRPPTPTAAWTIPTAGACSRTWSASWRACNWHTCTLSSHAWPATPSAPNTTDGCSRATSGPC